MLDAKKFLKGAGRVVGWESRPRVFFCHVPKCAGTSIIPAIRSALYTGGVAPRFSINLEASRSAAEFLALDMMKVREVILAYNLENTFYRFGSGHVPCRPGLVRRAPEDWSFITILRDPISRWVSSYVYNTEKSGSWMKNNLSIEEYLESEISWVEGRVQVYYFSDDGTFPDRSFIWGADDARRRCTEACNILSQFAVSGVVEKMDIWSRNFEARFGRAISIPVRNKSPHNALARRILDSKELVAEIRARCEPDLMLHSMLFGGD